MIWWKKETLMFILSAYYFALFNPSAAVVSAYVPISRSKSNNSIITQRKLQPGIIPKQHLSSFAAAMIFFISPFISTEQALASESQTAARIHLDTIPPTTVNVQIGDLPVLGDLLSGTYARLDTGAANAVGKALGGGESKPASVTIRSPADKVSAIRDLATKGHLEFDIDGLVDTHFDVDVRTPSAGELTVKISSPIIPSLPYKDGGVGSGIKKSEWAMVTNLGDGSISYLNVKTGEMQLEKPASI
mmetsp:Transcript_33557/g.44470  ORF Transcript_33557/g.44470 Transcript_33557/m.44470 type:complete len:246 (-) Transcript_33557:9-746(-)